MSRNLFAHVISPGEGGVMADPQSATDSLTADISSNPANSDQNCCLPGGFVKRGCLGKCPHPTDQPSVVPWGTETDALLSAAGGGSGVQEGRREVMGP